MYSNSYAIITELIECFEEDELDDKVLEQNGLDVIIKYLYARDDDLADAMWHISNAPHINEYKSEVDPTLPLALKDIAMSDQRKRTLFYAFYYEF